MRYIFEEYALDTDRRELSRGADIISVAPQVFDLLDYLIRNRERVVSKDDLINTIWNGRSVSDAALTTRLNVARNVIGDTGDEQRLIRTLPRKGFRFVGTVVEAREQAGAAEEPGLPLPDKPSIAVLPFQNMSDDPDQDYFADGMVDEITTALSRFKSLFVIARNSSFVYKGKTVDLKQIGRELGVHYVLAGSVRKAAGKVRIAGQLIDAMTGAHLWADRFEGDLNDIFALQDEVTVNVVSAIQPKLLQTKADLASRQPNNFNAYDLCLRAQYQLVWTRNGSAECLRLASRALEIDPRCGFAATLAAECHLRHVRQGWAIDPDAEIAEGFRLLRLALSIDVNATTAMSILGRAIASFSGDFDTAREMSDRAIALNPNSFRAWEERGWTCLSAGLHDEAIRSFERRIRLSPFDPALFATFAGMSVAYGCLGRFDDAVSAAEKAVRQNPLYPFSIRTLASALAHLGRHSEAREAVARMLELDPDFRISKRTDQVERGDKRGLQLYIDGLRKAGIPE